MHILFLTQVLPYPIDAGPKMRSYYVLRYLAGRHQVTLLSFVRPTDRPEAAAHLAEFCAAVHTVPMRRRPDRELLAAARSLLTGEPFLIARDLSPEMVTSLRERLAETRFDAILADQLWMARYALIAGELQPEARLILDQHNAVFMIPERLAEGEKNPFKRLFLGRETGRLKAFETAVCRQFDHVVWVTEEDRAAVCDLLTDDDPPLAPSTIIPICLDPEDSRWVEPASPTHRVTFIGGLHWPPNAAGITWFAREVWPRIAAERPDAVLTVIGKNPPAELVRLAAGDPHIEVTGYVADPTLYLAETGVFIVPLHAGGGMRVKVIEAWAWGLPIVSTTIGAEGIHYREGVDLLIADRPEDFAVAVCRLLDCPAEAEAMAAAGRRAVERHYDWRTVYHAWDDVLAADLLEVA